MSDENIGTIGNNGSHDPVLGEKDAIGAASPAHPYDETAEHEEYLKEFARTEEGKRKTGPELRGR